MKIAAPASETPVILCTKCNEHPRADLDNNNPWCNPCRAKYAKEYREMVIQRTSARAFSAGVEAMRKTLVAEFSRLQRVAFTGAGVAYIVSNAPRPQMSEVTETQS